MENAILESTEKLLRSLMISAFFYFALIVLAVLVTVGVIKFKLLKSKWQNIALVTLVSVVSVAMILLMAYTVLPVYKDYSEQSYVVVENARVVVSESTSVGIDRTSSVTVYDGEKEIRLKMQSDVALSAHVEYTGTIVYLEHSNCLVWYDFD